MAFKLDFDLSFMVAWRLYFSISTLESSSLPWSYPFFLILGVSFPVHLIVLFWFLDNIHPVGTDLAEAKIHIGTESLFLLSFLDFEWLQVCLKPILGY